MISWGFPYGMKFAIFLGRFNPFPDDHIDGWVFHFVLQDESMVRIAS
jgi:hypothetical protein